MAHPAEAWAGIAEATRPIFSIDSTTIFHLCGQCGLMQAWLMDADGGNPRQLSHHADKLGPLRRAPAAIGEHLHQYLSGDV